MSNLVLSAGVIGDWFKNLWVSLWLMIDNVIYVFINWMYRVFILVAKVDIFGGGEEIKAITQRLYLVVGIAMLFIFAYNLILLIVNPEGKQLGNMGKVVQNAIISIILVTLLPLIFSWLTTIQSHIIDSNVIGHVILGSSGTDIDTTNKKAGVDTALTIFSAFYHPKGETKYSCEKGGTHSLCNTYVQVYNDAYNNDDISSFILDDDLRQGVIDDEMEYNYFISSIAGAIALWIFVSFGLDVGVRVAKLAFYEIIAPIPVMMRILPNDKMYDKWFKGITSTFISLFIRLAVIFFCMYAITLVPNVLNGMWANNGDSAVLLALANVLIIYGILTFAQQAPKLVGDLFGGGGDGLDFSIGKKIKESKYSMGAMGLAGGGATALASNVRKMFSLSEKDPETGKRHVIFNGSNPFRGVVKGAVVGANHGSKSTTFGQLGGAITDGRDAANEVNQRYKSRHQKGEEWVKSKNDGNKVGDTIRGDDPGFIRKGVASIVDNVVEGAVGRGIEIKDAIVKGGKGTLDYLNVGAEVSSESNKKVVKSLSAIEDALKAFNAGITPIENTAKAWKEDYDKNNKISKEIKDILESKGISIDAATRNDVTSAINDWEKNTKNDKYGSNFDNDSRNLEVFREQIVGSLKDLLPMMSTDLQDKINKACGTENIQASIKVLSNSTGSDLAGQLGNIKKALNNEKTYIELVQRKKAEEGKK